MVTARDPARQATAEWQEGIKHGRRLTFEEFRRAGARRPVLGDRLRPPVPGRAGPARRCSPGGARTLPGRPRARRLRPARRARDPSAAVAAVRRRRRLRRRAASRPPGRRTLEPLARHRRGRPAAPGQRRPRQAARAAGRTAQVVKQLYAQQLLDRRPVRPSRRPRRRCTTTCVVVGERWVKEIDKAGYDVHGDLADLVPVRARGARPGTPTTSTRRDQVDVGRRRDRRAAARGAAGPRARSARLEADNAAAAHEAQAAKRRLRRAATERLRRDIRRVTRDH